MNFINQQLPDELFNMVLEYNDPVKEFQQKKQKKINRCFYMMDKKKQYDISNIIQNVGFDELTEEQSNKIKYPSVSQMKLNMEYYKENRIIIKKWLKYH
jgi:hypothetical protein